MKNCIKKFLSKIPLVICIFFIFFSLGFGKTYEIYPTRNIHNQLQLNTKTGEIKQLQDDGQQWIVCKGIEKSGKKEERFSLHETQNMWNFILLDSHTGRLWQLQYTVDENSIRGLLVINEKELADENKKNTFYISPLTSMFQYYLTNDTTGEMWKFQWNTKGNEYRWIEKIK